MDTFTALADPRRRDIIAFLGTQERSAGDIAKQFDISAPAISQHLKVLKQTGLVQSRAEAQRRIYSLKPDGLNVVASWVEQVRKDWNQSLDRLAEGLAQETHQSEG